MSSQGFNRYPNDILKLSFSYAWGVISIWKWYLWKGVLGSPEKSGILTLLHCSCPHGIWEMTDLCVTVREYSHVYACAHICSQKARRGHRAPFSTTFCLFFWDGISPRNLELLSSWLVWTPASSSGPPKALPWELGLQVCTGYSACYVGADI